MSDDRRAELITDDNQLCPQILTGHNFKVRYLIDENPIAKPSY